MNISNTLPHNNLGGGVVVVGSLHSFHSGSIHHSYQQLYNYIANLHPDVVAVEIRQEDILMPREYLSKYYPKEMIELLHDQGYSLVYGFDWLGESIKGREIPSNYFETLRSKYLEAKLGDDPKLKKSLISLDNLNQARINCISEKSIEEVNSGEYCHLTELFCQEFERIVKNTEYQEIIDFDVAREKNMIHRIKEIRATESREKKLVVITGLDHKLNIERGLLRV